MNRAGQTITVHTGARGSILITLVVSIVLAGALTAALLPMFNVTMFSVITQSSGTNAEYMALSGYRYAASELVHDTSDQLGTLDDLDSRTITFADDQGQFTLGVTSYWFLVDGDQANTGSLNTRVIGHLPDGFTLPETGSLWIIGEGFTDSEVNYSSTTVDSDAGRVVFSISGLDLDTGQQLLDGTSVLLKCTVSSAQTVAPGGNLSLEVPTGLSTAEYANIFPPTNGIFTTNLDEESYFSYERVDDSGGVLLLRGVYNLSDETLSLSLGSGENLTLTEQVTVTSTGSVGTGASRSTRRMVFNQSWTLPFSSQQGEETDLTFGGTPGTDMTDLDDWQAPAEDVGTKLVPDETINGRYYTIAGLVFQNLVQEGGYEAQLVKNVPTSQSLRGIWGNSYDNVYVVGDSGTILHFDGTEWTNTGAPTSDDLLAIWGADSNYIVATGRDGAVHVYNGSRWQLQTNGGSRLSTKDIFSVWGHNRNYITTYGEDGTSPYKWGSYWRPYDPWSWRVWNFYGTWEGWRGSRRYLFACGERNWGGVGFIFRELPNQRETIFPVIMNSIWGVDTREIYAVGNSGRMWMSNNGGNHWHERSNRLPSTDKNLLSIWGSGSTRMYIVGEDGTIFINEGDGWASIDTSHLNLNGIDLRGVWGSRETGIYAVGDNGKIVFLGFIDNPVASYFLPLDKNSELNSFWGNADTNPNKLLSYTIQEKIAWGYGLEYAASGINFRWAESPDHDGVYEGYGVSIMRYRPSDSSANDYIPDSMKPFYDQGEEVSDRVLLVLWKQEDINGYEYRTWMAYKDITDDPRVVGQSGGGAATDNIISDWLNLTVRVQEKAINHTKFNYIKVFYGDAVNKSTFGDDQYDNTRRLEYVPMQVNGSPGLIWPEWNLGDWSASVDYFTALRDVSVAVNPREPSGGDHYWVVNPHISGVRLLSDAMTIRDASHTSPSGETFGSATERPEIGVHVFGEITGYESPYKVVGMSDFAVRLGVPGSMTRDVYRHFRGLR